MLKGLFQHPARLCYRGKENTCERNTSWQRSKTCSRARQGKGTEQPGARAAPGRTAPPENRDRAMVRPTILDRYIAGEVVKPLGLGLAVFTFALVTGRMLKLTEMVVNHGVALGGVLRLLGLIMPAFFELTLPMAVLLGVLLGFGRLSGDRELIAARACGVSLYRLAVPVVAIGCIAWAISGWLAFEARPWAMARLQDELYDLARTESAAGLKQQVFNQDLPGIVLYVERIRSKDGSLQGVLLSDLRNPDQHNTVLAARGLVLPDPRHKTITLRLYDGSIFGTDEEQGAVHLTSFHIYDLTVAPGATLGVREREPEELRYGALKRRVAAARRAHKPDLEAETELAGKYTVPLASVLFAVVAVPLGLKPARGGQSERFGLSVALFFVYYVMMKTGQTFAQDGRLNPLLAMSIPDGAFALLGGWLFWRAAHERFEQSRGLSDLLWTLAERYASRRVAP